MKTRPLTYLLAGLLAGEILAAAPAISQLVAFKLTGDVTGQDNGTGVAATTVAKVNGNTPGNTCATHTWVASIDTSARGTCTQPAVGDISGVLGLSQGGTGQNAASAQALAYALKLPYVLKSSGTAVDDTAISTSEVNLASITVPALAANDSLEITTLWDTTGSTTTNTKNLVIRLSSASGCTPLSTCSAGTVFLNGVFNTSNLVSGQTTTIIRNTGATNSQVNFAPGTIFQTNGVSNGAVATAAVQTNAGSYINIDGITASSTSDHVTLKGYTVKIIPAN